MKIIVTYVPSSYRAKSFWFLANKSGVKGIESWEEV